MALGGLYALAAADDDRNAAVIDLLVDDLLHVRIVFRERNNGSYVRRIDSKPLADLLKSACAGGILPSGHAGSKVVGNADRDARPSIDTIQKTGHTAVGEGRVTDHGDSHTPELAAPSAIVTEAPISTQVWKELNGGM